MYLFFLSVRSTCHQTDALTISASSDYLRCTIANPQATNTIDTIHYLFVSLRSVHWNFRHL